MHIGLEVLLPQRKPSPKWKEFRVFSYDLLLLTIITILLSSVVLSIATKTSIFYSIFRVYQLFLQLSLNTLSKKWFLRIYLILLLIFMMEISAIYLTGLSSVFTKPTLEPKIKSLQELVDSDVPLRFYKQHFDIFFEIVTPRRKPLSDTKKYITEPLTNDHPRQLVKQYCEKPDFAFPLSTMYEALIKNYHQIEHLHFRPGTCAAFIYRKRGHLNDLIDYHIRNIVEKGLTGYYRIQSLKSERSYAVKKYEDVVVLEIFDLYGVFIIWICGLLAAMIAFILELIIGKKKGKSKKKMF